MSYMSSADYAVLRQSASSHDQSPITLRAPAASPVGPALEMVLLVATSVAVSLVFCTTVAGALLG
jgi:hypothetical protein